VRTRSIVVLIGALAVVPACASPSAPSSQSAAPAPVTPPNATIHNAITTRNGIAQHDSVSHALAVIERLGYESGAYDTFIRTDSVVRGEGPRTGVPFTPGRA
jgi:uncharacterized protein